MHRRNIWRKMRDPQESKLGLLKYENAVYKIQAKPRTIAAYDMILWFSLPYCIASKIGYLLYHSMGK